MGKLSAVLPRGGRCPVKTQAVKPSVLLAGDYGAVFYAGWLRRWVGQVYEEHFPGLSHLKENPALPIRHGAGGFIGIVKEVGKETAYILVLHGAQINGVRLYGKGYMGLAAAVSGMI